MICLTWRTNKLKAIIQPLTNINSIGMTKNVILRKQKTKKSSWRWFRRTEVVPQSNKSSAYYWVVMLNNNIYEFLTKSKEMKLKRQNMYSIYAYLLMLIHLRFWKLHVSSCFKKNCNDSSHFTLKGSFIVSLKISINCSYLVCHTHMCICSERLLFLQLRLFCVPKLCAVLIQIYSSV